jgi:hypothetical protein
LSARSPISRLHAGCNPERHEPPFRAKQQHSQRPFGSEIWCRPGAVAGATRGPRRRTDVFDRSDAGAKLSSLPIYAVRFECCVSKLGRFQSELIPEEDIRALGHNFEGRMIASPRCRYCVRRSYHAPITSGLPGKQTSSGPVGTSHLRASRRRISAACAQLVLIGLGSRRRSAS